jgi:hypothetical protein
MSAMRPLVLLLALSACGEEAPPPAAPTTPAAETTPGGALVLPVDPSVGAHRPGPDKTAASQAVATWSNFHTQDTLNAARSIKTAPPRMMLSAVMDRFDEREVVDVLLDEGKLDFWAIAELYRQGRLTREMEPEMAATIDARLAGPGVDPQRKINAVIGLVHVGFDDTARALGTRWRNEDWFQENWDANFYMGSMLFRYRDFTGAVPYLDRAVALNPDPESRLWLSRALLGTGQPADAERAHTLFKMGDHLAVDKGAHPFVDRADEMGLRRWQLAGAMAWLDVEEDGWVDLVANGAYSNPEWYRNVPGEGFVRQQDATLDDIYNTPPGMVAADFDNDGYTDLYLTQAAWFSSGPNRLLENNDGKGFIDRSEEGQAALEDQNSCGVAALDFDKDGLVDLSVTGTMGGTVRILRNKGGFEFEDVTATVGILSDDKFTAVGQAVGDINGDGWPDILVNTFTPPHGGVPGSGFAGPNRLYVNQGDGTFKEQGEARGVQQGTPMGFAGWMFDPDLDGDLDILATNFSAPEARVVQGLMVDLPPEDGVQPAALYLNDGSGNFRNVGLEAGFRAASIMGATYVDWDLDGDPDVILGPGSHPLLNMQPLMLYRNDGVRDGVPRFTLVTDLDDPHWYGKFHGMAFGDPDHDGDPDLLVNNGGVMLSDRFIDLYLENQTDGARWLHLRLKGTASNASAIGARIEVDVAGRTLTQEVAAGQGFSSTMTPYLIFGLGQAEKADAVRITWPTGETRTLPALAADQAIEVTEGSADLRRVY